MLIRNAPFFFSRINGKPLLTRKIEPENILLILPDRTFMFCKDYSFDSLAEIIESIKDAKKETLEHYLKTKI